MCITPSFIYLERGPGFRGQRSEKFQTVGPDGKMPAETWNSGGWQKVPVPCKKCWRCRSNRVNDFVARALCEADSSDWTCTLTLTYRDPDADTQDPLAHKLLTPRHFQDFIRSFRDGHRKKQKRWANRPFSLRYFAAGEYGDLKGRAHFHTVLFGNGEPPEIPHQKNTHIDQWPHGHVFADWNADERSLRYVMKYLLIDEKGKHWHSMSKYPPLGDAFFQRKADEAVRLEVFPSTFEYLPPGGDRGRPYLMTGATKRDYIIALLHGMANKSRRKGQLAEWVQAAVDKCQKWEFLDILAKMPRNPAFDPLTVPLTEFQNTLDRKRMTVQQAERVVFDSTIRAEYEASELLAVIRRKNHVTEGQEKTRGTACWSHQDHANHCDQADAWS